MAKKDQKVETIFDAQAVYTKTELFVDKNRKKLAIGIGGVALVFLGVFAFQYLYSKPKQEKAANDMWRLQQYMEIDSTEWALNGDGEYEGLQTVIDNYGGTPSSKLAHYYLGVIHRDKAEYQVALDHFKEADFDDEAVGIIAMSNVGDMYIELDNFEEGASWLEKAARKAMGADSKEYLGPQYLMKAARVYVELGNNDKAKGLFKEIKDLAMSSSPEYQDATKWLARLSVK
ncbi:MAG: tetratricopeptide repeat protein [Flavobacteriales bacterium]|nr:tetratricopeptide repeat protein [Flavobacteriales bacterium]